MRILETYVYSFKNALGEVRCGVGLQGRVDGELFNRLRWLKRSWKTKETAQKHAEVAQEALDKSPDFYVRFVKQGFQILTKKG